MLLKKGIMSFTLLRLVSDMTTVTKQDTVLEKLSMNEEQKH